MVLIGGVKYACERCIRGHRVTTCNHTDQPLIMIKPKGRPSTQCKHCKSLRVNKNVHSSSACTCGQQSGSKKKHSPCETGKPCDCGKKKPNKKPAKNFTAINTQRDKSVESSVGSSSISPHMVPSSISTTSRRAGEVVVPMNEYVPNRPQQEIGSIYNEKVVDGLFQDAQFPSQPGYGLLDLFDASTSSISTHSSAVNLQPSSEQYRPRSNQSDYQFSRFDRNGNSINQETTSQRSTFQLRANQPSSNTNTLPKSMNSNNNSTFDLFHNLGLSPTTEPQSATPTGHPLPHNTATSSNLIHQYSETPPTIDTPESNYTKPQRQEQQQQQSTGSLFGNYSNYPVHPSLNHADSFNSRSEVEVCSVTPSFHDINSGYPNDQIQQNNIGSFSGSNDTSYSMSNGRDNRNGINGLLDTKFKNDGAEFPEMLKF